MKKCLKNLTMKRNETQRQGMNKLICAQCDTEIGRPQRVYVDSNGIMQQAKVTVIMPCCGSVVAVKFSCN